MRTGLLVMLALETATAQPSRPPPHPDDLPHDGPQHVPQDSVPLDLLSECTLFAEIVPIISAKTASLRVVLKNTASTPAKVTLEGNCGARFVVDGEPRNTCPPSPCRPTPLKTYTIGAKRSLTLGTVTVKSKGDACREPMRNGSTLFEAAATGKQMRVCSGPAVHVIKDARSGALRKAKPNETIVEPARTLPLPPSTVPPTRAPKQPCPPCGIGCPRGRPSSAVDANGCRVCACEDLLGPATVKPSPPPPPPKTPTTNTKKPCPACTIGCPYGVMSSAVDANGCNVCKCEPGIFSGPGGK
jgi:hypothetical protein